MNCAEDCVKFLCKWLLENCADDMEFMSKTFDKTAIDRLHLVATSPFARITYTEAIKILEKVRKYLCQNIISFSLMNLMYFTLLPLGNNILSSQSFDR